MNATTCGPFDALERRLSTGLAVDEAAVSLLRRLIVAVHTAGVDLDEAIVAALQQFADHDRLFERRLVLVEFGELAIHELLDVLAADLTPAVKREQIVRALAASGFLTA